MSYLRLLKLLYIADRESMRETGRPITGDHAVAMDHGPVLERVYDLIKGKGYNTPEWCRHFQVTGYQIKMTNDPGVVALSRYELGKLQEVLGRYAAMTEWGIVEETHKFEEWVRNYVEGPSRPIPAEALLEAVGRADDVQQIVQDQKDKADFERLFRG